MKDGIGYPKFYIYDSTGVTIQSIPANIGTAGVISLSKNVTATNLDPERLAIFHEDLPYTHGSLEEFLGYRYRANITITKGSYHSTLLQYAADQGNPSYANDIYKMQCVQAYADAGYKIKFTPHNDLEDLWGTIFPVWVNIRPTGRGRLQTLRSDVHGYEIIGSALLSTAEAFYAFSFTHLNGIANTNQCINFDGSNDVGECTQFNCGTTHTIEIWMDQASPSATEYVLFSPQGTENNVSITATNITYVAQNSSTSKAHGGISAGTKTQFIITRNGTTVTYYKNGVSLGSSTLSADNDYYVRYVGASGASNYLSAKLAHVRIAQSVYSATQIALQYNSGYGNHPLNISHYAVWEMNGTGGTSTTETDQSGNSRTLTLTGTPTRTTW